ncbi:hypothetical protein [Gordonia spumicola]|nr:hypothetical protein [Gordonia spumicola]
MYPQQPSNQPGGWNQQAAGQPGYPQPGYPQQNTSPLAGLSGVPPLPAVLGVLLVIGFIGMFVGSSGSFTSHSSRSELCSAYSSLKSAFDDDSTYDVTSEVDELASVAKDYDDEGVQEDGDNLGNAGGSGFITWSSISSKTSHIRAECN